jgi:hypothetical protein
MQAQAAGESSNVLIFTLAMVGTLVAFLGVHGALIGARAVQRKRYEAMRDRLGLTGELEWGYWRLALSFEGVVNGAAARVDFIDGDDGSDAWELRVDSAIERGWIRVVERGRGRRIDIPGEEGETTGVAAFDQRFALVQQGPRLALGQQARSALTSLASTGKFRGLDWAGRTLKVRFETQTLAPETIEATLHAMAALAADR